MKYNTMTQQDIDALCAIVGSTNYMAGDQIAEDYSHDELGGVSSMPDVVLRVCCTEEISAIMRYANAHLLPVVVRGSGTGLVGAAVAIFGGIMIETTCMNKILELDEKNLTVTVQPGVLLMELAEYVQANNFLYPPDPGEKAATIGGNISTNAGGMRAVKYGVTRDYVRGLTVVMPDGEVLTLGGKVVKNSSGYSIKDLIIGAEGTLGIITEAILKLVPLPVLTVSLLIPFASMDEALDLVPCLVTERCAPAAIEYMSAETIHFAEDYLGKRFPHTTSPAYILLTFDGNDADYVEAEYGRAAEFCLAHGAIDVYIVDTDERKTSVWSARGAFLEAIKASTDEMDECDVVVPRDRIADYIKFTHVLATEFTMRIPSFGHAGDGNLHIYLCRDAMPIQQWENKKKLVFARLYEKAREMHGLVSGEHGIGYAKREYLRIQCGEEQIALMQRIKRSFDPNLILNPGKVCE